MRGRNFLAVALYLDDQDDEAFHRTQIGRYYYAAYLEARLFCERALDFERTRQSQEHRRVPQLISTIDQDRADNLTFLRKYRNTADYDLDVSAETIARNVPQAELLAARIIARLDALAAANPRPGPIPTDAHVRHTSAGLVVAALRRNA